MVADARGLAAATPASQTGGLGRATGERLCRQRGRLTPRNTGSSAKPLPNPNQGYGDQAPRTTLLRASALNDPTNCLTNKEDSFRRVRVRQQPAHCEART